MDQKKKLGMEGERAAAAFLADRGIHILKRNFRCRLGEIDIIAKDSNSYLMVEVKTRKQQEQGFAGEAVDQRKQYKICRVFDYFRMRYHLTEDMPVRFDVIELDQDLNCRWIRNAFEYRER